MMNKISIEFKFFERNDNGHDLDSLIILQKFCVICPIRSGCKVKSVCLRSTDFSVDEYSFNRGPQQA